jgi:hypothetical protein
MAFEDSQTNVSVVAGATFASTDLHKFIALNSSGHAVIGPTTASGNILGTLKSVTATTVAAGSEPVTVGTLTGIGRVYMAASTDAAGNTVAASSNGLGIAPTTDQAALGVIVSGSSGAAGRIASVAFIAAGPADV